MNAIPHIIGKYITAQNDHDVDQRLLCFGPDSTVSDEGETLKGPTAIRQWMMKSEAQYAPHMKPLACREHEGQTIVTAETSGTFKGSPITFDYYFTVKNDRISHLEIKVST